MNKFKKLLVLSVFSLIITSCGNPQQSESIKPSESVQPTDSEVESSLIEHESSEEVSEFVDYVSQVKLDLNDTSKIYQKVEVYHFVDGDTTHFKPVGTPAKWIDDEDGILKARYNSVDTPESTLKVEPWGKKAAKFTKEKLSSATSIIIQSDDENWNTDSTGGRYLVWVWYQPSEGADYRLLNLELIQEGLAKLKSASSYSLNEVFNAANLQAMNEGLKVYSEKDPDYYYGKAQCMTMKEMRLNLQTYSNTKVSVEGLVTVVDANNHMAYAEAYDDEDDRWYGMNFYMGFNNYKIIKPGNYLRLVGTLQYYETGGSWQVSGLTYYALDPDDEGSMKLLESGQEVVAHEMSVTDMLYEYDDYVLSIETSFAENVTYYEYYENFRSYLETSDTEMQEGKEYYTYETIKPTQSVYASLSNLTVKSIYTTSSTSTNSNGAMTIRCVDSNNVECTVRTSVLKHENGELVVASELEGKTINVRGIIGLYDDTTQIHVFTLDDLQIVE